MPKSAITSRYSTVAICFHWSIAALVVFNIVVGLLYAGSPSWKAWVPAHEAVGITILALTVGRVAWRLAHRPPPLPEHMAGWQKSTAHAMHALFYLLLLAMPLTGWAIASGELTAGSLSWFGILDLPLLPVSSAVANASLAAHELLGEIMTILVFTHIGAALSHHLVLRDGALARMAPIVGG